MSSSAELTGAARGQTEDRVQVETDARGAPPEPGKGAFEHLSGNLGSNGKMEPRRDKHSAVAMRKLLLVLDLFLVWGSAGVVMLLAAHVRPVPSGGRELVFPPGSAGFVFFFSVLIVLFAHVYGLYEIPWKKNLRSDLGLLAKSVLSAAVIAVACIYLWQIQTTPIQSIVFTMVASWISLASWRKFIRSQSISGLTGKRNILIVGCGPNGELLRRHLEQNDDLGYVFKGYVDRRQTGRTPDPSRNIQEADILGPFEQLPAIVRTHFIDEVFISVPSDRHLVKEIALHARGAGLNVRVVPDLYDGMVTNQPLEYVGTFPTITLNQLQIPTMQFVVKRLFDIVVSASLLILLAPVLLLIAVVIKFSSKGPVLYVADRLGRKGEKFSCYKFRTMSADADKKKEKLRGSNERQGAFFKMENDPRITSVGRWLRKSSLDELPQLWNVLLGHMSLVGPRPHPVDDCMRYSIEHLRRLDVTPGLTGLWQVTARRDPSFEKSMALDLEYIVNWSLGLDCRILIKTIGVVLLGSGQ